MALFHLLFTILFLNRKWRSWSHCNCLVLSSCLREFQKWHLRTAVILYDNMIICTYTKSSSIRVSELLLEWERIVVSIHNYFRKNIIVDIFKRDFFPLITLLKKLWIGKYCMHLQSFRVHNEEYWFRLKLRLKIM